MGSVDSPLHPLPRQVSPWEHETRRVARLSERCEAFLHPIIAPCVGSRSVRPSVDTGNAPQETFCHMRALLQTAILGGARRLSARHSNRGPHASRPGGRSGAEATFQVSGASGVRPPVAGEWRLEARNSTLALSTSPCDLGCQHKTLDPTSVVLRAGPPNGAPRPRNSNARQWSVDHSLSHWCLYAGLGRA